MPRGDLWKKYENKRKDDDSKDKIGRSTFFNVLGALTYSDKRAISCVDYVQGNLLDDPVEKLQRMIDIFFRVNSKERIMYTKYLTVVRNFLKVQFDEHIRGQAGDLSDGFHSLSHALMKKKRRKDGRACRIETCYVCSGKEDKKINVNCNACKFPFYFCQLLHDSLGEGLKLEHQRQEHRQGLQEALQREFNSAEESNPSVPEVASAPSRDNNHCASCELCRCPWVSPEFTTHHKCTVCGKHIHSFCFGKLNEGGAKICAQCVEPKVVCKESLSLCPPPRPSSTSNARNHLQQESMQEDTNLSLSKNTSESITSDITNSRAGDATAGATAARTATTAEEESQDQDGINSSSSRESTTSESISDITISTNGDATAGPSATRIATTTKEESQYQEGIDQSTYIDARQVIDESREKFRLLMEHRARVNSQRQAYDEIMDGLERECTQTKERGRRCLIIIDWKMKFESMSSRETMIENYGKRGIGWHGFVIIWFEWDPHLEKSVKKAFYIDQILDRSNKQDAQAVISMLEAAIAGMKVNLPFLEEAIISSDNAGCYQNKLLILTIGLSNAKFADKFFVSKLFHTKTQDGKGPADVHFSTGMAKCKNFMKHAKSNRITRINTPRGLAYALQFGDGMSNSIVQLIEVERMHVNNLAEHFGSVCKKIATYVPRASEIEFGKPTSKMKDLVQKCNWSDSEMWKKDLLQFEMTFSVSAHSGKAKAISFDISAEDDGTTKVTPDVNGITEYWWNLGHREDLFATNDDDEDSDEEYVPGEEDSTSVGDDSTSVMGDDDDGDSIVDYNSKDDFEVESEEDALDNPSHADSGFAILQGSDDYDDEDIANVEEVSMLPYMVPDESHYHVTNLLTRVKVLKCSYRKSYSSGTKKQKRTKKSNDKALRNHFIENTKNKRKDVLALCVQKLKETVDAPSSSFIITKDSDFQDIYDMAKDFELKESEKPLGGWARRDNGGGDLFGARHIEKYKDIVERMVQNGIKESSEKTGPAQILEAIQEKYPKVFSLPTEHEVRGMVQQILSQEKKRTSATSNRRNTKINVGKEMKDLMKAINVWLREDKLFGAINTKPSDIVNEVMTKFDVLNAITDTTDEQEKKVLIKKSISQTKSKLKSTARRSMI